MELRLVRYFLAVADAGSISRAALEASVAQPSLSRQIRQLEAEMGLPLFDRSRGRAELTAAGRCFLPLARDLVARADAAADMVRGLRDGSAVSLSLLAPETTVADVIAPFLASLPADAPMVNVREALPATIYEAVLDGAADLGISSGPPPGQLRGQLIVRFPIWAYVPPGHPLAHHGQVSVRELARHRLIVLGPDHGTRRLLDAAMAEAGVSYASAAQTDVPQVAQALAAAGRGVAVVSDDARYGLVGLPVHADRAPLRIPLFGAWDAHHYADHAIGELVGQLSEYTQERYGRIDA